MLPQVHRAQLVELLRTLGTEQAREAAEHLGFEHKGSEMTEPDVAFDVAPPQESIKQPALKPPEKSAEPVRHRYAPIPFVSVARIETITRAGEGVPPVVDPWTLEDFANDAPQAKVPTVGPLSPWSRLGPLLLGPLHAKHDSHDVDVDRFLERWSRSAVIDDIPRRERRSWCQRLVLLIDRSNRLMPFWQDQDEIEHRLHAQLGATALHRVILHDGLEGVVTLRGELCPRFVEKTLPEGPILVLSDLGQYGGDMLRSSWLRLGRRMRRGGRELYTLCPVPRPRWDAPLARTWQAISWERDSPFHSDTPSSAQGVEGLLTLLSPLVRIEPGLLRAIRRLLPMDRADAGTEADLWQHRAVEGTPSGVGRVEPGEAEAWRERLRSDDPALRRRLVEAIQSWRRDVVSQEIWFEEALRPALWDVLTEVERAEVRAWVRKLRATLESDGDEASEVQPHSGRGIGEQGPESPSLRASVASYARRLIGRLPSSLTEDPEIRRDLSRVAYLLNREEKRATPGWFDPSQRNPGSDLPQRSLVLSCRGRRLFVTPEGERVPGSFVAEFKAREPRVYCAPAGQAGLPRSLDEPGPITFDLASSTPHVVWTDEMRIELEFVTNPYWATRFERNRQGLLATLKAGDDAFVARRILMRVGIAGTTGSEGGKRLSEPAVARWEFESRPSWASDVSADTLGLSVSIQVDRTSFLMRWIPPGTFVMGSSESEEGREAWEWPSHQVTLTRGFWLAQTPVTQELWQAIMGDNPSQFQSPDRPVEQVSWEDCKRFIERLNELTGGGFRLPSETEWEYACRAGTTTSTYAGEMRILGANNAPVLDAIAWYGGNSGVDFELSEGGESSGWPEKQYEHSRAGAHPVGRKQPNAWGLFDMLGNVYEWCEDAYEHGRDRGPVLDPHVPEGSGRVIRGGSWDAYARRVRAAYRRGRDPGDRWVTLGFRLARGQVLSQAEPGQKEVSEGAGEAGRGTSRRTKPKRTGRRP